MDSIGEIGRMSPTINRWRALYMFDQEKTGKFIAENRKQKGLTQKDLAERLGISNKTVSKCASDIIGQNQAG